MAEALLRVEGITKAYGNTVANDGLDLELHGGEVHGLLGQNGAGKSTLVGILTGHLQPDSGTVSRDGAPVDLSTPVHAARAGIAGVYQHLLLVPSMTGIENLALGLGESPSAALRKRMSSIMESLGLPISLDVPVQRLDMAARQRLEFARALCQSPTVLLLDEPTAFLPPAHIDGFLDSVRRLADTGIAVLLITHRLEEVRRVCDRITVIRAGKTVASYSHEELPGNDEIALSMLGARVVEPHASATNTGGVILSVKGLHTKSVTAGDVVVSGVDLDLREGEIVGITGVDGNGQAELLDGIAGLRPSTGTITLGGHDISGLAYSRRHHDGLQLLPADRQHDAIIPDFSVFDHFDCAQPGRDRDDVLELLREYDVQPPDPDLRASFLSGGNQQKVMLARAFSGRPRVLMMVYPTQGLDVSAAARIQSAILAHARDGTAFLVVSGDLDELLNLCDRILVMYRGHVVGEAARGAADTTVLAQWFTGVGVG
jgi:simple sugar transport system ATP-binding protein